ncbi:MAG: AMP-binding protein [Syntrophales bacterium]
MSAKSTGSFTAGNYVKVAAARYDDREAYYCTTTGRRLTFHQFNERVNRLANGLLSLGVRKGDVTAFLTMNRIEIIETYGALGKIGSIGIPLNYRLSPTEIADLVSFCDAENIIFDPFFFRYDQGSQDQVSQGEAIRCHGRQYP